MKPTSAHFQESRIRERSLSDLQRRLAWLDKTGLPAARGKNPIYFDSLFAERKRIEAHLEARSAETGAAISDANRRAGIFAFPHLDGLKESELRARRKKLAALPDEHYYTALPLQRSQDQAEIMRIDDHLEAISGNYPRPVAARPPTATARDVTRAPDIEATRPWRETHPLNDGVADFGESRIAERSAQECLDRLAWRLTRRPLKGKRGDGARAEIRRLTSRLAEVAIGATENSQPKGTSP